MQDYTVINEIGHGAYGHVYLVRHKQTGKHYCVKTVSLNALDTLEAERSLQEAKILTKLKHRNIIKMHGVSVSESTLLILMELAEGGDLAGAIRRMPDRKLETDVALNWFAQICLAIKHIHDRGIIHRDLKPSNILLAADGTIKVADFGVSKIMQDPRDLCCTMIGTPLYIAPEVLSEYSYDTKVDIWSLGCILYEMLTGMKAFDAENIGALLENVPSSNLNGRALANLDPEIIKLLDRMLYKNPAQRPDINEIIATSVVSQAIYNLAVDENSSILLRNMRYSISIVPSRIESSKYTCPHPQMFATTDLFAQ